ncbi:MAG: S46 family peptidase [Prevotella sp.]|nr:S46 family peptidase [Prevotella sp.]
MALTAMLSAASAQADEGMWTLYNLPQAVYQQMQAEGFTLPYADLYQSEHAVKNAVVNFCGYCSGVVVSPNGLVFTNHHCGFEAIRSHSTVEHDYMLNGFAAKSYEEELPNEDMFVSFMVEQKDVTKDLEKLGLYELSLADQSHFLDSIENAWSKEVKAKDSTLRLEIKPFFEGNAFYATTYRDFTDLRLVFTVPKSMGKFGGETDNWMWPRQTCDFSVFRIYADPKTNGPAKYSKDNVPYRPESWAPVSLQGYQEGSFSMTMGYPGSTNRYISSFGIRERRDAENEPRAQVRGVKQEVMQRHMRADEAVRIKYDSKFARSANYWKNSIGMNKCIDSIGLIRQKADFEAAIRRYQDSTGYLKGKLDLDLMKRLYDQRLTMRKALMNFNETFRGTCELVDRAIKVHNGMAVKGPKNKKKKQYVEFADNSETWDEATEKEVLAVLMDNYRKQVDKAFLPDIYQIVDRDYQGDYARYINDVWSKSVLMKSNTPIYINKKSFMKDPGVKMGLALTALRDSLLQPILATYDSINLQERYLCNIKLRMEQDLPHYSDANFTMRLSYGQVGGFLLGGAPSGYYTTSESLLEKMKKADRIIDYFAEPVMHQLMDAPDYGIYADKQTGKMQLCFLTNNDITGGNSGSPMFNGKGELIGLAFDGNWDSLSSDLRFDRELARCIGVDVRYMLYMMDKWGHADRLIQEIQAK